MKMPTAKKAQEHVVIASFGSETNKKIAKFCCVSDSLADGPCRHPIKHRCKKHQVLLIQPIDQLRLPM